MGVVTTSVATDTATITDIIANNWLPPLAALHAHPFVTVPVVRVISVAIAMQHELVCVVTLCNPCDLWLLLDVDAVLCAADARMEEPHASH